MIDQYESELIHKELDGENSPQDSARVKVLVESNPEAGALFEELEQLGRVLHQSHDVDPPSYLRKHIMNSLPATLYSPRPLTRFAGMRFPVPRLAFVVTIFAGIAIGVGSAALFMQRPAGEADNISQLVGSTVVRTPISALESSGDSRLSFPGGELSVVVKKSADLLYLGMSGVTTSSFEVRIDRPNGLVFDSFHQFRGNSTGVSPGRNEVTIDFRENADLGVLFRRQAGFAGDIHVQVTQNGSVVADKMFAVTNSNSR